MIIVADIPGQLGNSLILYANFLAFGWENNVVVYNPGFYRYSAYFSFSGGKYGLKDRFAYKLFFYYARVLAKIKSKKVVALDWHERVDLDDPHCLNTRRNLFIQGWQYRGNALLNKYKEKIKDHFTPAAQYLEKLNDYFKTNFTDNTAVIIGVHIRRGDYESFENGKYFFSLQQYTKIIAKTISLFAGQKVHFLVCSNEKFDPKAFSSIKAGISFGPGHELLDMYALSRCNYIIGPPSTYTMWASFYGNTPLRMLHDIEKDFTLDDFRIQTTF